MTNLNDPSTKTANSPYTNSPRGFGSLPRNVPYDFKHKAKIQYNMQFARQRELDETVDSFFDRNKLYLKTAIDHQTNKSRSKSKEPSDSGEPEGYKLRAIRQSQTLESVDLTTINNQVVNKQEYV